MSACENPGIVWHRTPTPLIADLASQLSTSWRRRRYRCQSTDAFIHHLATSASSSGCRGSRQHHNTLSVFLTRRRALSPRRGNSRWHGGPILFLNRRSFAEQNPLNADASLETRRPHCSNLEDCAYVEACSVSITWHRVGAVIRHPLKTIGPTNRRATLPNRIQLQSARHLLAPPTDRKVRTD